MCTLTHTHSHAHADQLLQHPRGLIPSAQFIGEPQKTSPEWIAREGAGVFALHQQILGRAWPWMDFRDWIQVGRKEVRRMNWSPIAVKTEED